MSIIDVRTVTCNGPNCDKTIAFTNEEAKQVTAETPWLKGLRVVQTSDGRNFCYCSDVCLVEGAATGILNPIEEKKIIAIDAGKAQLALRQAQLAARARQVSDDALKSGSPVTIE